jgi:peptidyl-dipeptidase Dcp
MENWCYEKDCLDLFAKHYETGEAIPAEYIDKIKKSANFMAGMGTIRQVGLGKIDMGWHSINSKGQIPNSKGQIPNSKGQIPNSKTAHLSSEPVLSEVEVLNMTELSVKEFEAKQLEGLDFYPEVKETITSTSFSHIFQGGYSSGYYSYKWAEVLDADAFEAFLENGIFDRDTAKSFQENILSAGGTEHPSILYKRFRGRDAKPDALLKRAGLV